MSGHTPGPWIYDSGSFYAAIQLGEDGMTYEATIIDMGGGRPDDHQANARLIAAAPDLLAAAKLALANLQRNLLSEEACGQPAMGDDEHEAIRVLSAAIAKATGETQ